MEKKNKKETKKEEIKPKMALSYETKKSIFGVLIFTAFLMLWLSFFDLAGFLGEKINFLTSYLFGVGKFILSLIFLFASLILIASEREHRIYLTTFLGGSISFTSLLALIALLFHKAGMIGELLNSFKKVVGVYGSFVFWNALFLVGVFLMFDISFKKLKNFFFKRKKSKETPLEFGPFLEELKKEPYKKRELTKELSKAKEEEGKKIEKEIEEPKPILASNKREPLKKFLEPKKRFRLPLVEILEEERGKPNVGDLQINMNIIKRTLENFGIRVEMGEVDVGPTVTRYTLRPAQGIKLSKIVALQNELALALAAHPIRIEAPIPGKSLVGIEVPNKSVILVRLRNLLKTQTFKSGGPLTFPLGRDVSGVPVYADLSSMPHLLIAGATGSGKSICIHALICSLLFKNSFDQLKFILIDPKKVELTLYENLPHLLSKVVIEPKNAITVLKWAISEMDRRYSIFLEKNVRDIFAYQKLALKKDWPFIPFIVIVIDELADLMASFPKEMEASIIRLAQLARATGIHLVVSTQRPSTDVITGLIKANITSRIAMKVASQVDSRTIIDIAGAEKLLGCGDMLFISPNFSKPKRIQGVYISVAEIERIVNFWQEEKRRALTALGNDLNENNLSLRMEKEIETLEGAFPEAESDFLDLEAIENKFEKKEDPLYEKAYQLVVEAQKASTSYLQRKLSIGYSRAARLIDLLEERGVIGPQLKGSKAREVYHKPERLKKFFSKEDS